jgi:two-component system phosphate regulon sensor histidine kinase PhoR
MTISSKALRIGLVVSSLIVILIIIVQLFWLKTVYAYEEKQFATNISKSIKGLYEDLELNENRPFEIDKLIETPKNDLFLVRLNSMPDIDTIRRTLSNELTSFEVFTDCKVSLYDNLQNNFTEETYIDLPDTYRYNSSNTDIPVYKRSYPYLALYFPHRGKYIIKQMYFWIVSSGILFIVLIGFSSTVFYLYRQKFLYETQKDFVNNFTHEFKTPLSVIKIASDVLQQPSITNKPERLHNYAGIISEQTTHLQNQVQRLLQTAFTDQHQLPLVLERFNVDNLIKQAIEDLHPLMEEKKTQIRTIFTDHDANVVADKSHLLLVIINLIENAIKFSSNPIIEISTFTEDLYFCIEVKDNGLGIAKEHQKKIYDRFYRVTTGNVHISKGFGLGLNFVKKIIDAHHGKIEVSSEIGKGSIFTIKIPKTY